MAEISKHAHNHGRIVDKVNTVVEYDSMGEPEDKHTAFLQSRMTPHFEYQSSRGAVLTPERRGQSKDPDVLVISFARDRHVWVRYRRMNTAIVP